MKRNKRKRGSNTTSSSTAEAEGYVHIHFTNEVGVTYPHLMPKLFTSKMVAKCEDLIDVASLLIKTSKGLDHIGEGDVRFRHADQGFIHNIEDFKACLSKTKDTDPIIAIVPDRSVVGHEPTDTKKSEADKLLAQYEAHAPSSLDAHTVRRLQMSDNGPLFRCDRPYSDTLPAPLLHLVFGEFEDNLHDTSLHAREDYGFVREFCCTSLTFFKLQIQRQQKLWELLKFYLRTDITSRRIKDESIIEVDGCISGNTRRPIYAILEVENELACTSTLKYFQGLGYYARFCVVEKESGDNAFLLSNCPAFLIEILGPHIRVSAMTFQDRVTSTFLTDVVNVAHSNSAKLVSVFKALKLGLRSLESFYKGIRVETKGSKRLEFLDQLVPYSLWLKPKFTFKTPIGNKKLVFLAEDANQQEVVVKFCKRYGDKVHKAWYESGFAPELLEVQVLGGGYKLVVMEFLGPPWKPFLWLDEAEKKECRLVVLEALKKVHGLSVFCLTNPGSVHGDAREVNIMVRRGEGVFKVKFLDFDWAGQECVSTYPFNMNHIQISWPNGAADGMPMHQSHDVDVVSNPPGPSLYHWMQHV